MIRGSMSNVTSCKIITIKLFCFIEKYEPISCAFSGCILVVKRVPLFSLDLEWYLIITNLNQAIRDDMTKDDAPEHL